MNQPFHDSAAIVSIGDELTLGQKLDTNSQWISCRLVDQGVMVREHVTLADDLQQNIASLRRLCEQYPLVVTTGGLGPTLDDLTRQALGSVMGEELVEDAEALAAIRTIMERRGRPLTENQRLQALRPRSARMIPNSTGTAPGFAAMVRRGSSICDVFCLPGPPREMQPMFDLAVTPNLRLPVDLVVRTKVMHCLGIGEGDLAQRLGALMERDRNPLVGTTASGGVVSIRIRYEGPATEADSIMRDSVRLARDAASPFIFGEDEETIEASVLRLLQERSERLVLAESCTAGGLGELFSTTAGSSSVLIGGFVTYSNEMKTAALGVPGQLIKEHGAVSEPVARAMALGALERAEAAGGANHALAITGVAGPDGGSVQKPVGTVFIACASTDGNDAPSVEVRRFLFTGDRIDIRDRAAKLALAMLRWRLLGVSVPRVLWQIRLDGTPITS